MKEKLRKINYILIGTLIILQPFIIMFQATVVRDIQLFGISIFESFNIAVAVASVCLTVYVAEDKKVFLKYIPYVILLGGYILAHSYNIYQFNNEVYTAQTPSFLVETYYIVRTFIVPILLVFTIYYSGMTKEQIVKILIVFISIIVFVLVITNIFRVALRNYAERDIYNVYNLFDWFGFDNKSRYSYYELTTKGWFLSGNQMSAILFMTFPIIVYQAYKMRSWYYYVLVTLQMLSMYMMGTKTANVGCLLVMSMFIGMWIVFKLLKHKEKNIIIFLAILIAFCALFPFSPVGRKIEYENNASSGGTSDVLMLEKAMLATNKAGSDFNYEKLREDSIIFVEIDSENMSNDDKIFVKEYMSEFCSFYGISPFIIDNYSDLEHSVFWTQYIQKASSNDYRVLKTMIMEDIYKNNNNPLDKYLGMGYTLNYIYTEADYTHQFYAYGIIGLLVLIGPYVAVLLYIVWQGLRYFKKMFKLECAMYAAAPAIGLCVAKMSGHVLERTFPLIVLAIVESVVLLHVQESVNEK